VAEKKQLRLLCNRSCFTIGLPGKPRYGQANLAGKWKEGIMALQVITILVALPGAIIATIEIVKMIRRR
jgi:hypothetical protein